MKTILFVDDEESICLLYETEFGDMGYKVVTAKDGDEALQKFEEVKPDLVTLDIKMPGPNGIDVLRRMKEKNKDVPVIMCTAYTEFKQDFGVWASDAYIVKSSDLGELKSKVKEILG